MSDNKKFVCTVAKVVINTYQVEIEAEDKDAATRALARLPHDITEVDGCKQVGCHEEDDRRVQGEAPEASQEAPQSDDSPAEGDAPSEASGEAQQASLGV